MTDDVQVCPLHDVPEDDGVCYCCAADAEWHENDS